MAMEHHGREDVGEVGERVPQPTGDGGDKEQVTLNVREREGKAVELGLLGYAPTFP